MTIDFTKFDWSAVAAIGQVAAAVATIVSLWLLWRQIRLTKDQVELSNKQTQLSIKELAASNQRALQAKHEAVYPVLVVTSVDAFNHAGNYGDLVLIDADEEVQVDVEVQNAGVGPAKNITITRMVEGASWSGEGFPGLTPENKAKLRVVLERPADAVIRVRWSDVFGKEYFTDLFVDRLVDRLGFRITDPNDKRRGQLFTQLFTVKFDRR